MPPARGSPAERTFLLRAGPKRGIAATLAEVLCPITFVVVAQHVAASLARRHGRDPERLVGLSKVTRTR